MICSQTRVAGVSVSQVARRNDLNANLVFTRLRNPRFSGEASSDEAARSLPVEIVEGAEISPAEIAAENRVEIDLAGGHRVRISGNYDPDALARLIRGLSG